MTLLYNKNILRALVVVTGLMNLYYLWWRIAFTINEAALIFSIILLLAEIQGLFNFGLYSMMTWNVEPRPVPEPLKDVSVDVFIPTYNEDISVLEATLVGCMHISYPHKTYLLDDGNRPEVKALAELMGCGYLFRTNNEHAKAGNVNAALKSTDGEFVVILDADMVPQPDFLDKTLGYFSDSKVAIVQLPQEFYNLDSVQHSKGTTHWHEQQLFYHVIQPGKDRINSAFWCGSPSVIRRKAILDVGGVATDSVTEDFLTSIRLNAKGWRIRYHHEALAFGIAPQSYHAFSVQRRRWAQGAMKILFSHDNPLIKPGLKLRQRLSHFAAIFTYFDAYQKLIYILVPVIFLFSGVMPLKAVDGTVFLMYWVPYFVLSTLTTFALGRGYFNHFQVEKYNTLKMITFIKASLTFFLPKRNVFRVTPKTTDLSVNTKDRKELTLYFLISFVAVAAMIFGAVNLAAGPVIAYPSLAAVYVVLFWTTYNALILGISLHSVLKRTYQRQDYRYSIALESCVSEGGESHLAKVVNISRSGLGLTGTAEAAGENASVEICLEDGLLTLPGNVVYRRPETDGERAEGIRFDAFEFEERMRLYNFLYVTIPRRIYDEGEIDLKWSGHTCSCNPAILEAGIYGDKNIMTCDYNKGRE